MLSIQVKSASCPTQITPGPRSPGAATVTDTGVVRGIGHDCKLFSMIFLQQILQKINWLSSKKFLLSENIWDGTNPDDRGQMAEDGRQRTDY
jgi:hypothetical protein